MYPARYPAFQMAYPYSYSSVDPQLLQVATTTSTAQQHALYLEMQQQQQAVAQRELMHLFQVNMGTSSSCVCRSVTLTSECLLGRLGFPTGGPVSPFPGLYHVTAERYLGVTCSPCLWAGHQKPGCAYSGVVLKHSRLLASCGEEDKAMIKGVWEKVMKPMFGKEAGGIRTYMEEVKKINKEDAQCCLERLELIETLVTMPSAAYLFVVEHKAWVDELLKGIQNGTTVIPE